MISIRRVGLEDLREVVGAIDRSEHVDGEYAVVDGRLIERAVTMSDIPPLDPIGDGFHSVAAKVQFCASVVDEHAGVVLGAFNRERVAGVAVVAPSFDRRWRGSRIWMSTVPIDAGVASALWDAAGHLVRESRARQLYVSATPTASAVGFYRSRGCRLADPVHPVLFEHEPDDIHLVGELG